MGPPGDQRGNSVPIRVSGRLEKKEKWVAVFNKTQLRTGKFEQNNEVANDAYSRLIKVTHKGSLHNY